MAASRAHASVDLDDKGSLLPHTLERFSNTLIVFEATTLAALRRIRARALALLVLLSRPSLLRPYGRRTRRTFPADPTSKKRAALLPPIEIVEVRGP